MSNINLQNQDWLEVVFQDKNKAYGAYQLRKENDKTTLKALLVTIGFVFGASLLLSFTTKDEVKPNPIPEGPVIVVSNVFPPAVKPENKPKGETNTIKSEVDKPVDPIIVEKEPEIKPIDKLKDPIIDNPNGKVDGDPNKKGTEGDPKGIDLPTKDPIVDGGDDNRGNIIDGPVGVAMLTKGADFPGGINKFREYVGTNYRVPDNMESGALKLMVSFVVEIDGSMTNFKVINSVDKELEKEAFRVLKSMKTKWIAGEIKGTKVRSFYSLPITIQVNNNE